MEDKTNFERDERRKTNPYRHEEKNVDEEEKKQQPNLRRKSYLEPVGIISQDDSPGVKEIKEGIPPPDKVSKFSRVIKLQPADLEDKDNDSQSESNQSSIEEKAQKSEDNSYKPYVDKHDYGTSEKRLRENSQEPNKHDFTTMMNISNDSWQKGEFFEHDQTKNLIQNHKYCQNGFKKVKHNIRYATNKQMIKVLFKDGGDDDVLVIKFARKTHNA